MPSGWPDPLSTILCLKSVTLPRSGDAVPHTPRGLVAGQVSSTRDGTFCMPWVPWMESIFQSDVHMGGSSLYHNYKGFHSIVLLALVDGDFKFVWVEVGAQIFKHSDLTHKIEDGSIGFPESEPLGIGGPKANFFMLGNDAFPLKLWLMKPCSRHSIDLKERVFNYRISRGRRVVENAFGILKSCFRIFQSLLQQEPPVVTRLFMACFVLHNLLRIKYPHFYMSLLQIKYFYFVIISLILNPSSNNFIYLVRKDIVY